MENHQSQKRARRSVEQTASAAAPALLRPGKDCHADGDPNEQKARLSGNDRDDSQLSAR